MWKTDLQYLYKKSDSNTNTKYQSMKMGTLPTLLTFREVSHNLPENFEMFIGEKKEIFQLLKITSLNWSSQSFGVWEGMSENCCSSSYS